MIPGEIVVGEGPVVINAGRPVLTLVVANTGDRPAAWGHRLAVPAGTAVRFEPGIEREVDLVPLAGNRVVPGLRGEAAGPLDALRELD